MKYDIIIVGAGTAGLVAAYRAVTKNPQLNILVLEKEKLPGRKLSASGNGKCNLTNSDFRIECYHSNASGFISDWHQNHSHQEVISFFEELGVLLYEKGGYFYPLSNQAKQVSTLLYEKSNALGVEFRMNTRVTQIQMKQNKTDLFYEIVALLEGQMNSFHAANVILATGGVASPKLGGCKDGYQLAKQLKMQCTTIYPVLSPVYVADHNLSVAKGVRIDGNVTLHLQDGRILKESGQIQVNDNNFSGIVMMNLSCYLNHDKHTISDAMLHIDVLPQYSWDELKTFFVQQKDMFPDEALEIMLRGVLASPFAAYLCKRLKLVPNSKLKDITDKQINRLTSNLKKLEFEPVYIEDFEKAQVTGGGIATDEVSVDTFESMKYKHLYIVGEVLDVNGQCGGYNLTFAVLSAIQAIDDIVNKV